MGSLSRGLASRLPADVERSLLDLRHDLHRHPELSWQEQRTASKLEEVLRELGARDVKRVAETGVVARIPGRNSAGAQRPVVALRGDIDALPIEEDTGLEYSSQNVGVMHACGHDVHASWTVGAASLLLREPAEGDVLVVLQPAEEVGTGAPAMLASGCLDEAAVMFGAHVDRRYEVGQVVAQEGPVAAATDDFEVKVHGSGGHGARPHLCIDPIVAAAAIVQALQTLVSRRLDPGEPGVVSVGVLRSGTASNVIPESAEIAGTIRSCSPQVRQQLADAVAQVCRDVAAAHGARAEVEIGHGTPPIVNPPEPTAWARRAVEATLGPAALAAMPEVNMGGEDFAFYLERMPGCFLRIGAREPGGEVIGAHTPRFYAADGAVGVGAVVLAELARIASRELA